MAEKKRQHFVPQLYLRNYSVNPNTLYLFNINLEEFIRDASLKDQCSEKYYYGRDLKIEKGLEVIESNAAQILSKIIAKNFLPKSFTNDHYNLMTFIVTLEGRSKYIALLNSEMIDSFTDHMNINHKEYMDSVTNNATLDKKELIETSLFTSLELIPISLDLGMHIFNNRTNCELISSDNPVVHYNKYCEDITDFNNRGLASSGLQIFLPLSPRKLLHFYDTKIYRIGLKDKSKQSELNEKDVYELNKLQYLNALYNIYYSSINSEVQIKELHQELNGFRNEPKVSLHEYSIKDSEDSLLHIKKSVFNIRLDISSIKLRKGIKKIPVHERGRKRRNQLLLNITDSFIREVLAGKYGILSFLEYWNEK